MDQRNEQFVFLNHPNKIKVQIFGSDLKNLFTNSALAIMGFLYPKQVEYKNSETNEEISIKSPNLENLLADWLAKLLAFSNKNDCYYNEFEIAKITETELKATIFGRRAKAGQKIAGISYKNLEIKKTSTGFLSTITLDT